MVILYTLNKNSYINMKDVENIEGKTVYVNMTNRCPCSCTFCLRQTKKMLESNSLWLKREPTVQEVKDEFDLFDLTKFKECVFCGFGEPTERLDDLLEVAHYLKEKDPDLKIRINTNGLANLMYETDITPRLQGLIDTISISLNSSNAEEFLRLTRSKFGIQSYDALLNFATKCKSYVPNVVLTVVDIIGEEEIAKCQNICDRLKLKLRVRPYEE